jgi:ArsR family transcriptional regulator
MMERDELREEAYKLHAQVCSIMANPKRLQIIELLSEGEKSVEELTQLTGLRKANVSQHLALLRHYNIVSTRKEGLRVHYKMANPKVIQACRLMREVTLEQLSVGKQTIETIDRRRKVQERR